jgi:hypothetical protein
VVDVSGHEVHTLPIGGGELRARVAAFRDLIKDSYDGDGVAVRRAGRRLFETLLAPAIWRIAAAQRLVTLSACKTGLGRGAVVRRPAMSRLKLRPSRWR